MSDRDRTPEFGLGVDRWRAATVALALLAAVVAVVVAVRVFPYRSLNHDEGVYLQQAELLLRGRLFLRPPVDGAFDPWFFVDDGGRLYAKYAPVPAAVFALGKLAGGFPLALAAVAAAVVGLTAALGRELFDGPTGALAGILVLGSPLFLVQSGVYLPYPTTTALNLAFALAYLRAERRAALPAAAIAGVAVGLAFFARPYTAVLFAAPFVAHACWTLARSGAWRAALGEAVGGERRALLARRVATAGLGAAGVAVALGYNWVVTGDPLLFPYQAFAPLDGIGFGHRELLGHEEEYTVGLALRSNAAVVRRLFADWVVAGPLGTALAAVGVFALADAADRTRRVRRALLAALFVTIPLGNVAFWGNRNILGSFASQTDGLIHFLGPYYHFDLLVPTAVFGAHGAVVLAGQLRETASDRLSPASARRVSVAALVASAAVFGGVAATTAAGPLAANERVSDELRAGYEPFADGPPADAVVYLPTPYGPWLNHPFQALRNDPGFDGRTVYALDGRDDLAVAAAYPNRTLYRYVYAGAWAPTDGETVDAELRRVARVEGESVRLNAAFGIPEGADEVTLRVATERGAAYYVSDPTADRLRAAVTVSEGRVRASGPGLDPAGNGTVAVGDPDEVTVEAHVSTGPGSGFSYRLAFPVETADGRVRALSPTPRRCRVPDRCVPAGLGEPPAGAFVEATLANGTAG